MSYPSNLKYTKDHEWVDLSDGRGRIGVTDYAQQQLGDVVYIELPKVGDAVKRGESFGTIESVKAVSELFAPVSGQVVEVNSALKEHPEAVNATPHETWLIVVAVSDMADVSGLLDAGQYAELVK